MFIPTRDKCPFPYLTNVHSHTEQMSIPIPDKCPFMSIHLHYNPFISPFYFHSPPRSTLIYSPGIRSPVMGPPLPVVRTKKKNGSDTMCELTRKEKLKEFNIQAKLIERKLSDKVPRAEANLLLHVLIFHFDGFARQQQLVNRYILRYLHLRAIPRTLSSYEARLESSFVPLTICRRNSTGATNALPGYYKHYLKLTCSTAPNPNRTTGPCSSWSRVSLRSAGSE